MTGADLKPSGSLGIKGLRCEKVFVLVVLLSKVHTSRRRSLNVELEVQFDPPLSRLQTTTITILK